MENIITITMNPAIDASTEAEQVFPEKKLRCTSPSYDPGGGGINVSRAIARLGGSSTALYPVGGSNGSLFESLLGSEDNVSSCPVRIEGMTRKNLTVYERSSGNQFRFGMPGPELTKEEKKGCLDALRNMDTSFSYCVASGSLPVGVEDDFYLEIGKICEEKGLQFILDTSGEALRRGIENPLFMLKPNIAELQYLTRETIEDESSIEGLVKKLMKSTPVEYLVVSIGSDGVLFASRSNIDAIEQIKAPTVPIRSKVGAGDSMVAGIVLALQQGKDIADAVRFGVASGTAAVMTPGTELCRKEDTLRIYERIKREA